MDLTIKGAVVVILSIIILIAGIFLTIRIMEVKDVLKEIPMLKQADKISVGVEPPNSQKGTSFLIKANYIGEREQQDLSLMVEGPEDSSLVTLYDDGKHYDGEAGDRFYASFFDSTNKPNGTYRIKYKEEILASFTINEAGCEIIEGASSNDKIDFVLLTAGYNDYNEFKEDAKLLLTGNDSLLKIEPFKSNKDKFAFFIINTTRDLNCSIGCYNVPTLVCCNDEVVLQEAARCHHESILVLVKSKELCGSASSYTKMCSENEISNLILVHETGHSFADLADEYTYSDFYNYSIGDINAVNCDVKGCEKWKNITSGCFQGCTYSNLYRPAEENSIMYQFTPEFNLVCKAHVENLIDNYVKAESEKEKAIPESYFVNLNYNKGEITIHNVFLKLIESGEVFRQSDYNLRILDKNRNIIFSSVFYVPDKIFPISGSMIFEKEFNFSLLLPYFPDAEDLVLYKNDRLVANTSLSIFSQTCGNGICEESENHVNCPRDCPIKDNFCETSFCDPDCPSKRNCEFSNKIVHIVSALLIAGALVLLISILLKKKK